MDAVSCGGVDLCSQHAPTETAVLVSQSTAQQKLICSSGTTATGLSRVPAGSILHGNTHISPAPCRVIVVTNSLLGVETSYRASQAVPIPHPRYHAVAYGKAMESLKGRLQGMEGATATTGFRERVTKAWDAVKDAGATALPAKVCFKSFHAYIGVWEGEVALRSLDFLQVLCASEDGETSVRLSSHSSTHRFRYFLTFLLCRIETCRARAALSPSSWRCTR